MTTENALNRPKQRRSRQRVQLILEATREVLRTDGVQSLSTNAIAARAQIPVSSIYQYFPNKEAIVTALYEDYLQAIRATYEELDTEQNLSLHWKDFISLTLARLGAAETGDKIERQLALALQLYPELLEIDRRHEDWITDRLVDSLKKLGAKWPRKRLKRMVTFLYQVNSAIWYYRMRNDNHQDEIFQWHRAMFFAVAEECFE